MQETLASGPGSKTFFHSHQKYIVFVYLELQVHR